MRDEPPFGHQRYEVPIGVEIAAAWSWRLIVISVVGYGIAWVLGHFSEVTVPIAIALLMAALLSPLVNRMHGVGLPRGLVTFVAVLGFVLVVGGLLTVVGTSLSSQFADLRASVVDGISQVQQWARNGPLHLTDAQLSRYVEQIKQAIGDNNSAIVGQAAEVGTTIGHVLAGFFIVLFGMFFFLYDGDRIWQWLIGLFPANARERADLAGQSAWLSLTAFVRATVLVAFTDAVGVMVVALILQVPLVFALGVLVFLGAFIPIIGALLSGMVAVLVALVAQGPWAALFMLLGVIAVQQLEAHVLQPFLMGRLVAVHPLAIIVVIAVGVIAGGIVGALLAVPFAASLNSVVRSLAKDPPAPVARPDE